MAFSVTQHHLNSAETANTEKDSVIWTGKLVAQTDNWPIFRRLLLALKESDTHWVFTFKSSLHTHFVPCANYRQVFLDWLSTIWIKSMDNLSWAEWIWNHLDLNVSHVSHAADRTQLLLLFVLLRTCWLFKTRLGSSRTWLKGMTSSLKLPLLTGLKRETLSSWPQDTEA